jgi:thiol-disulfide isomerase/thioredoxin
MKANQLVLGALLAGASTACAKNDAIGPKAETLVSDRGPNWHGTPTQVQLPIEGALPALDNAGGWINSQSLKAANLRGKVVLVDFWTYSCINWRRTLPYLRAWADKYRA